MTITVKNVKKIDRRKTYYIVIDTETAYKHIPEENKGVNPYNALTYDIGWAVVDKAGNVYKTRSYVVSEFFPEKCKGKGSFYYELKKDLYIKKIRNNEITFKAFDDIMAELFADAEEYGVKRLYAHYARFDYVALNATADFLSHNEHYRQIDVFENIEFGCTYRFTNDTIAKQKTYREFCEKNGFMTKHKTPRPQTKAEVVYAYIISNPEYNEEHTGLADVLIEKDILAQCIRQHKKTNHLIKKEYVKVGG